ncbi:SOS response-associated peptidase family protein [Mesorhizobium sp. ORM6]
MCRRVHVKRTIAEMVARFSFADPSEINGLSNQFPFWNGAPRLTYPIIVVDELVRGTTMFVPARWGLILYWVKDRKAGSSRSMAGARRSRRNGMFKAALRETAGVDADRRLL